MQESNQNNSQNFPTGLDFRLPTKSEELDVRFQHPFTCLVNGPTKSGKTNLVGRLVVNSKNLIHPPPKRIVWCYNDWQPAYDALAPYCHFNKGLPRSDFIENSSNTPTLLILDDLMQESAKDSNITDLYVRGCHHRNFSVIQMLQNLFFNKNRTQRINCHYLVMMKSPGDKLYVRSLGNQIYPNNPKFLIDCYNDACKENFGYLLLDLSPCCDEKIRLRSKIFPGDLDIEPACVTYVPTKL